MTAAVFPVLKESLRLSIKKDGQEYEQFCDWLGTNELDLKTFDADKMNIILKDFMTELKDFYEGG